MKKIYSILFAITILFTKTNAQSNCSNPFPFVSGPVNTYTIPSSGPLTDMSNDYGCLPGTGSSAQDVTWIYLGVCSSGSIMIDISSAGTPIDLDFVAWGPLTSPTTCGLTAGDIASCSYSTATTETVNLFSALAGEYYKIMVTNFSGTATGSFNLIQTGGSGSACISTLYACPGTTPSQQICQVTTDPALNKNIIIWEKDTTYTEPYFIERETTTMGVYATIATVANNDTSAYVDTVSNPMIQAFKYRIGTTDTCGLGIMAYGSQHQTIHLLTSTSSSTGYPQLNWSNYYGFPYYTYFIYRGASPTTLTLYDSISASFNTYTDVAAVPGLNFYSVSVNPPSPCQPSRSMTMGSFSNVSPVMFTGINEYEFNQLTVGPNPAFDVLNFTLGNVSANISVDIIDITGRIVFSKRFENVNQDAISLNEISNGCYVIRFTSENKTTHRNIIIAK